MGKGTLNISWGYKVFFLLLLLFFFLAPITAGSALSTQIISTSKEVVIPQRACNSGSTPVPPVTAKVDPNMELLSIALSMTTWFEDHGLSEDVNYPYAEDIRWWFGNYSEHVLIKRLQRYTDWGFTYEAPINFICHFGLPPALVQRYNYSWTVFKGVDQTELNSLAEAFRTFAVETNFMTFYANHQSFYEEIETTINAEQNWTEVRMLLERFFGEWRASYAVILAPFLFPGGGYGGWVDSSNGTHVLCVIRTLSIQNERPAFGSAAGIKHLALHEFAHSFVNPVVDRHLGEILDYEELFMPVAANMSQMGYGSWPTILSETLVRAFTAWAYGEEYGAESADTKLAYEEGLGFYFVREIYNAYREFLAKRDKYPRWEDFFPEIVGVLENVATSDSSSTQASIGFLFLECLLLIGIHAFAFRKKAA
ncbi:MAG: DUF4932 domain-containing protein [Candidatus Hodarchaeales archaeon]|jgi:hypothetical protein